MSKRRLEEELSAEREANEAYAGYLKAATPAALSEGLALPVFPLL